MNCVKRRTTLGRNTNITCSLMLKSPRDPTNGRPAPRLVLNELRNKAKEQHVEAKVTVLLSKTWLWYTDWCEGRRAGVQGPRLRRVAGRWKIPLHNSYAALFLVFECPELLPTSETLCSVFLVCLGRDRELDILGLASFFPWFTPQLNRALFARDPSLRA